MTNENNSNVHPIFQSILDSINPKTKPYNRLLEEDLTEPVAKPDLKEIAEKSHYEKRMSGDYEFLELTPDNIATFQLGFYSGCIHVTEQNIKKLEEKASPTLHRQDTN